MDSYICILSSHPDCSFVAVDPGDSQPGRQVQHVLENLLVQLQVGQLALPLQGAQVDLVRGQVLSEPSQEEEKKKIRSIIFIGID